MKAKKIQKLANELVNDWMTDDIPAEVQWDYEDATGYYEIVWYGYSWRHSPSGEYHETEDDELFWEMVDDGLAEHGWSLEFMDAAHGDGNGLEVGRLRWLARTWNELTAEEQARFVDYS